MAASSERQYLGRPSNSVSMGIVGLPNVGKSTLFNIMSNLSVPAENYPFCTIDPNVAKVPVPDDRFNFLCGVHKPKSEVPAVLSVTDIAGLVRGAAEGRGLGNAFLSHIMAVDGIFHVVRAFKDEEIEHVEGSIDPVRDLEIIHEELILKDLERVKNKIEGMKRAVSRGGDKALKQEYDIFCKCEKLLEEKKDIRSVKWPNTEVDIIISFQFLSAKSGVFLVNISKEEFLQQKNKWVGKIKEWVKNRDPNAKVIPFSAKVEAELAEMDAETREKYCTENKTRSMIPTIITTGYHALDLVHFFTAGSDEVRAWTVRRGALAPAAAGVIHTDFQRCFISAMVMAFADFKEKGSESAVKAAGKYKTQGKGYVVEDGDIMFFQHNAGGAGKKK